MQFNFCPLNFGMNLKCVIFILCVVVIILDDIEGVIDGIPAQEGQFPYAVLIKCGATAACSGSIIDKSHIITAGHCVAACSLEELHIVAGKAVSMPGVDELWNKPKTVYLHPDYQEQLIGHPLNHSANDIAIIEVQFHFALDTAKTASIQLPSSDVNSCSICIFTGWGATRRNGPASDILMWTSLRTIPYSTSIQMTFLLEHQFTAYDELGVSALAAGDSGGALNCNGQLTGILLSSWSRRYLPAIFLNIFHFRKFITGSIKRSTVPWSNADS